MSAPSVIDLFKRYDACRTRVARAKTRLAEGRLTLSAGERQSLRDVINAQRNQMKNLVRDADRFHAVDLTQYKL